MMIRCNDDQVHILATQLEDALLELGYEEANVATALNGEFVPKSLRTQTKIREGDRIDIVAPMQGG